MYVYVLVCTLVTVPVVYSAFAILQLNLLDCTSSLCSVHYAKILKSIENYCMHLKLFESLSKYTRIFKYSNKKTASSLMHYPNAYLKCLYLCTQYSSIISSSIKWRGVSY